MCYQDFEAIGWQKLIGNIAKEENQEAIIAKNCRQTKSEITIASDI